MVQYECIFPYHKPGGKNLQAHPVRCKNSYPGPTGSELSHPRPKDISSRNSKNKREHKPKISNNFTWETSHHPYSKRKWPFQIFWLGVGFLQNVLKFQSNICAVTISSCPRPCGDGSAEPQMEVLRDVSQSTQAFSFQSANQVPEL